MFTILRPSTARERAGVIVNGADLDILRERRAAHECGGKQAKAQFRGGAPH
jgi:hypothetical protein